MLKSASKYLFASFICFSCSPAFSQESQFLSDIGQLNIQLMQNDKPKQKHSYIYHNETHFIRKINPVGLLLGGSLYIYQNIFSRHFSADCLYIPSCSGFSKIAIREEGILKGMLMTIDRVNRCNRIAAQDLRNYDPNPLTSRFDDPVSRYMKSAPENEE